jgi:HSP20 family protein
MPSMDVSETDGEVRIRTELPGVGASDIDVSFDGDVLVIRGEKKLEKTGDEENYLPPVRWHPPFDVGCGLWL